jgi:hypothetical protein
VRYAWTGVFTAIVTAIGLIHFFVLPLDVLWVALVRRLGV